MMPPNFSKDVINDFLTPDAVKDFLSKRKNYRRAANSKSGSCVAPPSGEWCGTCKECRSDDRDVQEITYCLSFNPCGTVEGTGSIPEGEFVVKGVYNMAKGIVAWRQIPSASPCEHESKLTAEFVGEIFGGSHLGRIVGSVLTTSGEYYSVDLRVPQIQASDAKLPLPTLLTGGASMPKGAGTQTHFYSKNSDPMPETSQGQRK